MSWCEADFLAEHEIDEVSRIIIAKPGTEAEQFDKLNRGVAA